MAKQRQHLRFQSPCGEKWIATQPANESASEPWAAVSIPLRGKVNCDTEGVRPRQIAEWECFNPLAGKSELRLRLNWFSIHCYRPVSIPLRGKVNCDTTRCAPRSASRSTSRFNPLAGKSELRLNYKTQSGLIKALTRKSERFNPLAGKSELRRWDISLHFRVHSSSFNPLAGKSELRLEIAAWLYCRRGGFNPLAGKSELRPSRFSSPARQRASFNPLAGKSELRHQSLEDKFFHMLFQSPCGEKWIATKKWSNGSLGRNVSIPLRGKVNCDFSNIWPSRMWDKSFNPLAGKSELRLNLLFCSLESDYCRNVSIPLRGKVNCDLKCGTRRSIHSHVSIPLRGKVNCDDLDYSEITFEIEFQSPCGEKWIATSLQYG